MGRSLILENKNISLKQIKGIVSGLDNVDYLSNITITPLSLSWNRDSRLSEKIANCNNQYGCIMDVKVKVKDGVEVSRFYLFCGTDSKKDFPTHVTVGQEIDGTMYLISELFQIDKDDKDAEHPTCTRCTLLMMRPGDYYAKDDFNIVEYDITGYADFEEEPFDKLPELAGVSTAAFGIYFGKVKIREKSRALVAEKRERHREAVVGDKYKSIGTNPASRSSYISRA